jgi:ligand-binding sensor domain-containing protein
MKNKIVIWLLFVSGAVQAQSGNYFLSHFSPNQKQSDNVCFDMVQDKRGVFYFATQAGVLQFDGRNWEVIRTNGAAYAIELSENGEVYVGGAKGFGKITQDESGLESFQPLYERPDAEYIFQLEAIGNSIYFLNEKNLFRYLTESDSVTAISTGQILAFASLNEIFGSAYVSMENGKLLKLKEGRMEDSKLSLPDSTVILFSSSYEKNYLVGTSDNRIFLGTGNEKLREVHLEDSTYVNASEMINATWVNTELVALATLRGGIVFINPETGKTTEIINYSTGLPDNEIYTLISDRNQNVWAAHSYGFTRIAPYLPMRSFRHYPGLQGNLLCAITFKGNVYVGTSLGLFKLEKEEFYDELTYYVDVLVKPSKTTSKKVATPPSPAPEEKTEKGGFFKFLRKKETRTSGCYGTQTNNQNQPNEAPLSKGKES